jgi:hypothetical protein
MSNSGHSTRENDMASETIVRWESDRRYYAARMHQDLLGDIVVAIAYGGLYNNIAHTSTQPVADQAEGERLIAAIDRIRTKHKYRLIERRDA